jgi:hypothetical protein
MRPPFGTQVFERAQQLVDRRRLLLGLCAAVAVALIAAALGVLNHDDNGKSVKTTESAQATPVTTGVPVVTPEALEPAALPPSPTTTSPALVLGTSFSRPTTAVPPKPAAQKTTATTKAPAPAPAPPVGPKPTTGRTTPFCHNSYDPACGPFRWEPAPPADQPRQVTLTGPQAVRVGDQVTVHADVNDPDDAQASNCPAKTYDFGDGPAVSNHCDPPPGTDPCPKRYGPWSPPAASPGGGQEDVAHTFSAPGTYTVKFTYDPGYQDACYNPYASDGAGTMQITVTP